MSRRIKKFSVIPQESLTLENENILSSTQQFAWTTHFCDECSVFIPVFSHRSHNQGPSPIMAPVSHH